MARLALCALPLLLLSVAACGGEGEDTASAVGNAEDAASFFRDDKIYVVRITGWDGSKMTPQALQDETTVAGATLRILETRPTSERHCPDGEGTQVYETKLFSLRTSGNFTKGTPKSSYKVKITEGDSKKRFLGMKDLNLKSMWNDVSQIELGPADESPSGFETGDAATSFPVPTADTFEALHVWSLSSSAASKAPDISDLAVSPTGELHLLSDEGRLIALVESNLGPTEDHAKLTRTWKLPKKAKHPEGLVFLPDETPVIAIDSTSKKKNGFVLAPLD
ncbi:MAG: CotH kinase family protein [Polyangiaceae bacterium]